jgi:glycosyltransferase involved in cell wall biosynthesis
MNRPLRVLFAAPAYWPATAFGGPVQVMRELASGLTSRDLHVDVVTTSLLSAHGPRSWRTRTAAADGAAVVYAATPVFYRWMGITPSLPMLLEQRPRPDVVHVFGFRDPVGTIAAAWCAARRVPYVFEGLGMFAPKLRKVGLKRLLDASLFRHVPAAASTLIASSRRERDEYLAAGVSAGRVVVRPNGFPRVGSTRAGGFRSAVGVAGDTPLVLAVGRVADGKGLEMLVHGIRRRRDAHLAIIGPDEGHGAKERIYRVSAELGVGGRVHMLGPRAHEEVMAAYADADVVALASAHESFGMVAAEAAAAGKAVLLTDRCGVAELLAPDAALVTPYEHEAVAHGLGRLLDDEGLRHRLGAEARRVADRWTWDRIVTLQLEIYLDATRRAERQERRRALGTGVKSAAVETEAPGQPQEEPRSETH